MTSYMKTAPQLPSAALSFVAHAVVITACVVATMPADDMPVDSIANRVVFIPPPDRVGGQQGSSETVTYVALPEGPGVGAGPRKIGDEPPLVHTETVGEPPKDTVAKAEAAPIPGPPDSVFSVLEVDTPVARSANSAAPAYPLKLLTAHIMGAVSARYVVDTTGFADTTSFVVLSATNPEFITAVREALPYMRFAPAKIGSMKVRQLVEQQFTFKINDTTKVGPKKP